MKIGKYTFTKKEIIIFILVYLPLVLYFRSSNSYPAEIMGVFVDMLLGLFFFYPLYLIISLKFKKIFKWIFLGFIPSLFIAHFYILREESFNLLSLINWATVFSSFIYPAMLVIISTTKEFKEMFKEMNFWQILTIVCIGLLMFSRIILNFIRNMNR